MMPRIQDPARILFVFDLDDTLIHEGWICEDSPALPPNLSTDRIICHDTHAVLECLGKRGSDCTHSAPLVVCSLNRSADRSLQLLGIRDAFDSVYQPESTDSEDSSKTSMLSRLLNDYGLSTQPGAAVLFDDVEHHSDEAHKLGMRCVLVDWHHGITLEDVKTALL